MKTAKWVLLAGLVVMLMTMGCDKMMTSVVPQPGGDARTAVVPMGRQYNTGGSWFLFYYWTPSTTPEAFPISIGQDNGVTGSTVTLWTNAAQTKVYAEFNTAPDWYIVQAHLDVKVDSASLTHNKSGNLMPGKFPGQAKFDNPPPVYPNSYPQTCTIELDMPSGWTDPVAVAALSYVCQRELRYDAEMNPYYYYYNFNTGCGGEGGPKTIRLPAYDPDADPPIEMRFVRPPAPRYDNRSHWDVELRGIPDGYNVWDGHWVGWCGRFNKIMSEALIGPWMKVRLYSCYDPELPAVYAPDPIRQPQGWNKVSWLINEYSDGNWEGWYDEAYFFNEVCYYLLGQYTSINPLWDDRAKAMAAAADEHGDYYPELPGSWFAVICHPVDPIPQGLIFQPIFIEVDP